MNKFREFSQPFISNSVLLSKPPLYISFSCKTTTPILLWKNVNTIFNLTNCSENWKVFFYFDIFDVKCERNVLCRTEGNQLLFSLHTIFEHIEQFSLKGSIWYSSLFTHYTHRLSGSQVKQWITKTGTQDTIGISWSWGLWIFRKQFQYTIRVASITILTFYITFEILFSRLLGKNSWEFSVTRLVRWVVSIRCRNR